MYRPVELLHLTCTALAGWVLVDHFYMARLFGDWVFLPLGGTATAAMIAGLSVVYRHRGEPRFLPVGLHVSFGAALLMFTFLVAAIASDLLRLPRLSVACLWTLPFLAYVGPCLAWRYRQHGQASVRVIDAWLIAIALVLLFDAQRLYIWRDDRPPDPLTYRFAEEGVAPMAVLAAVAYGILTIRQWRARRRGPIATSASWARRRPD